MNLFPSMSMVEFMSNNKSHKKENIFHFIWFLILISIVLNVCIVGILRKVIYELHNKNYQVVMLETYLTGFLGELKRSEQKVEADLKYLLDPTIVSTRQVSYDDNLIKIVGEFEKHKYPMELAVLLERIHKDLETVKQLWADVMSWRKRYSEIFGDIQEERSLKVVLDYINTMRTAIFSIEAKRKLKEVKWLREYKNLAPEGDVEIANKYFDYIYKGAKLHLHDIEHELMDLAVFIIRLAAERNPYNLIDLKDNKIKQSIERLEKGIYNLERQDIHVEDLSKSSLNRLITLIFGRGYFFDNAHQTVIPGEGGIYLLQKNYLDLLNERKLLLNKVEAQFAKIDRTSNDIAVLLKNFNNFLSEHLEESISRSWKYVLAISVIFILIFLIISWNIISFIRKQLEERDRVDQEIKAILQGTGDAIRVIDMNFNILKVNNEMGKFTEFSTEESIGQKCYNHFPGEFCNTDNCTLRRIMKGEGRVQFEAVKRGKKGKNVLVEIIATPLKIEDKVIGVIESCRDITERR